MSKLMKRTVGALRQKAFQLGLPLVTADNEVSNAPQNKPHCTSRIERRRNSP